MGYIYIVEMFCNHWSFCWEINDLNYIFEWYPHQNFEWSENSKNMYEEILLKVKRKLESNEQQEQNFDQILQ